MPPEPRAQALPCRTACSLIYEGQAGTGPSGRQGRQALRKVWGCPDPVAARREPAREAGTATFAGADPGQRIDGVAGVCTLPAFQDPRDSRWT